MRPAIWYKDFTLKIVRIKKERQAKVNLADKILFKH